MTAISLDIKPLLQACQRYAERLPPQRKTLEQIAEELHLQEVNSEEVEADRDVRDARPGIFQGLRDREPIVIGTGYDANGNLRAKIFKGEEKPKQLTTQMATWNSRGDTQVIPELMAYMHPEKLDYKFRQRIVDIVDQSVNQAETVDEAYTGIVNGHNAMGVQFKDGSAIAVRMNDEGYTLSMLYKLPPYVSEGDVQESNILDEIKLLKETHNHMRISTIAQDNSTGDVEYVGLSINMDRQYYNIRERDLAELFSNFSAIIPSIKTQLEAHLWDFKER